MQDSNPQNWDANAHYKNSTVAAEYDAVRFSSVAGKVFNRWERAIIRKAFRDVPVGSIIADIPCGTGRLAEPLIEAGYRVHGMDISADMLEVAKDRLKSHPDKFTTEVADAKTLEQSDENYDAVLCARVLMHFELAEQIEFLKGAVKLTNGVVVINQSLNSPFQRFRRWMKRLLGHQTSARFPVTSSEIDTLLKGAGLEKIRHYRLNPLVSEAIYVVARPVRK